MDIKIENYDIALSKCNDTVYIDGIEEIAQRVRIACTVEKGAFVYDTSLGRDEIALDLSDELLNQRIEMIFKEACVDIPLSDIKVTDIEKAGSKYRVKIKVICGDESADTEVIIDGDL